MAAPPRSNAVDFDSNTFIMNPSRAALADAARRALSPGLRSLLLIGSCLSEATRREGSIPDLFAIVDSVDQALARLGSGALVRKISPLLPPTTVSLCVPAKSAPIAKLNLVEPAIASRSIRSLPDLYLAGRLSKRAEILFARDDERARELCELCQSASLAVASAALLAPPRSLPLEAAVRRCFLLSYLAEIRPEREASLRARFDAFAPFYFDRFGPLLRARALEIGARVELDIIRDDRSDAIRRGEAIELGRLLRRSRLRSIARWPKQALVYRGWAAYIAGKIRRSRAA